MSYWTLIYRVYMLYIIHLHNNMGYSLWNIQNRHHISPPWGQARYMDNVHALPVMIPSHGNTFCIIDALWGESLGHQWIDSSHKGPVMRNTDVLLNVGMHKLLNKQSSGWWSETPWCSFDIIVMGWIDFVNEWKQNYHTFLFPTDLHVMKNVPKTEDHFGHCEWYWVG